MTTLYPYPLSLVSVVACVSLYALRCDGEANAVTHSWEGYTRHTGPELETRERRVVSNFKENTRGSDSGRLVTGACGDSVECEL